MAVGAVIGVVVNIITTILNVVVRIIQQIFQFIVKGLFGISNFVIGLSSVFFIFIGGRIDKRIDKIDTEIADDGEMILEQQAIIQERRSKSTNPLANLGKLIMVLFKVLQDIVKQWGIVMAPLLAAIIPVIGVSIGFIVTAYIIMIFQDIIITSITSLDILWGTGAKAIVSALNLFIGFLVNFGPVINLTIDMFYKVGSILFEIVCPNLSSPNLADKCPVFVSLYNIFVTNIDVALRFYSYLAALATTKVPTLLDIICPNGICPATLCQIINVVTNNDGTCDASIEMVLVFVANTVSYLIETVLPYVDIGLTYFFDIFAIVTYASASLLGSVAPIQIVLQLPLKDVVSSYAQLKATLVASEVFFKLVVEFTVDAIVYTAIVIDSLFCNAILGVKDCLIAKCCFFMFSQPLYIPTLFGGYITIPLDGLCTIIGLSLWSCPCDKCPVPNPFGNYTIPYIWDYKYANRTAIEERLANINPVGQATNTTTINAPQQTVTTSNILWVPCGFKYTCLEGCYIEISIVSAILPNVRNITL
jgi:hypothetical protein